MALLDIKDLCIAIATQDGLKPVVQGISMQLEVGQTLGIVGESGCGKSITALVLMGLTEGTQIRITGGSIGFDGQDLLTLSAAQRRELMGNRMAMIFQEPMTSLNPVYRVGAQIVEAIQQHQNCSTQAAYQKAEELLRQVGIPESAKRLQSYPHQLSGGMRQRVMIAMALSCEPLLLIADEPTTALDVTIQAQILQLLKDLQQERGMALILISHDLGAIANMARDTLVMYRGTVVEAATTQELFAAPGHPYTQGLLGSIPDPDHKVDELATIPGRVPMMGEHVSGCQFHPRCSYATDECRNKAAPKLGTDHLVYCHHPLTDSTQQGAL